MDALHGSGLRQINNGIASHAYRPRAVASLRRAGAGPDKP